MTPSIRDYNGVTLAYIGDAVIELMIREALIQSGISDTGKLSAAAQKLVCAKTQSAIAERLLPELSSEEEAAYRLDGIIMLPENRKMQPRQNTAAPQVWKPFSDICT